MLRNAQADVLDAYLKPVEFIDVVRIYFVVRNLFV